MAEENALKVEIYKDQDFYVPAFVIIVGQEKLNPVVLNDILNVTYTDSLANVDSFDMTVSNWDAGANKFDQTAFKYSDKDIFNPWKDVEVQMGYYRNGKSDLFSIKKIPRLRRKLWRASRPKFERSRHS